MSFPPILKVEIHLGGSIFSVPPVHYTMEDSGSAGTHFLMGEDMYHLDNVMMRSCFIEYKKCPEMPVNIVQKT